MMRKAVVVAETQRGLLIRDGRLIRILEPGRHILWDVFGRLETHVVDARGVFASPWAEIIEKRHPDLAREYLEIVRVAEGEVAIMKFDGRAALIVRPGQVVHVWKVIKDISVDRVDTVASPRLTKAELVAFEKAELLGQGVSPIAVVSVSESHSGLVFFDGELNETLKPGRYGYWQVGRSVTSKMLDMRPLAIEVTAQEILTKDRVALRVTLTSFVKVVDVEKAALSTPDYTNHIYRLVQFGVREAIAGRTLDEVLNDRETVDEEIVTRVRREIGDISVAVTELGIKDVILPGDMRALINKVVEAEKTAQANIIRRREETAATRSLLNTARLMEESPTLLRLKELEALERVTEKIGRVDVHASSGEGLNAIVDRLVSLKPRD